MEQLCESKTVPLTIACSRPRTERAVVDGNGDNATKDKELRTEVVHQGLKEEDAAEEKVRRAQQRQAQVPSQGVHQVHNVPQRQAARVPVPTEVSTAAELAEAEQGRHGQRKGDRAHVPGQEDHAAAVRGGSPNRQCSQAVGQGPKKQEDTPDDVLTRGGPHNSADQCQKGQGKDTTEEGEEDQFHFCQLAGVRHCIQTDHSSQELLEHGCQQHHCPHFYYIHGFVPTVCQFR